MPRADWATNESAMTDDRYVSDSGVGPRLRKAREEAERAGEHAGDDQRAPDRPAARDAEVSQRDRDDERHRRQRRRPQREAGLLPQG